MLITSPNEHRFHDVAQALAERGFAVTWADCAEDVRRRPEVISSAAAIVVDTDETPEHRTQNAWPTLLERMARWRPGVPVFLAPPPTETDLAPLFPGHTFFGYILPEEDTPDFIAGRIRAAVDDSRSPHLPPFFQALMEFDQGKAYSWHTPGHAGGVAFLKSAVGRTFFEYYGEKLFRTDLSISAPGLGSLLDHQGAIGEAERNAARVFGSDFTFFVLNGTSSADRIVGHHCLGPEDRVLIDRNCHKAIVHTLVISGARPEYMLPTRNSLGLIGPVPPARLTASDSAPENLAPLAVVTNSTYDGVCYDAVWVSELLSRSTGRVHFDEAWFGYAHFHPLYRGRYGMAVHHESFPGRDRPTVFTTQSTHKVLSALSQSAMLHVRSAPREPVDAEQLNETYVMHASTSPLYPMIASLDVAAGMMDGPAGRHLVDDAIREAVRFRQTFLGLRKSLTEDAPRWFFDLWQPPEVRDPSSGAALPFAEAPLELLVSERGCWELEPGADWHGFEGLESGYCMLDPLKVTIVCPGARFGGDQGTWGIPAPVLAAFLEAQRILVEKTSAYTILVLFSLGNTRAKSLGLLKALERFKDLYDNNAPLNDVLPQLVGRHPSRYAGLTLPQLCAGLHGHYTSENLTRLLDRAFTELPEAPLTPAECHRRISLGEVEQVPLAQAADRISASTIVVTPPGIPLILPGERTGPAEGPRLRYLRALEEQERSFPGFSTGVHGVERNGEHTIKCLPR
ncbi:Orn/Lys/Arg family decarboxylase [Nocardiopsis valliformis]|uniref:Orn/Lys/Arg family decarboxylase n=1 Tax=Nocardiopsis valliformis TaxID=239974 RepID=UPI00373AEA3B